MTSDAVTSGEQQRSRSDDLDAAVEVIFCLSGDRLLLPPHLCDGDFGVWVLCALYALCGLAPPLPAHLLLHRGDRLFIEHLVLAFKDEATKEDEATDAPTPVVFGDLRDM